MIDRQTRRAHAIRMVSALLVLMLLVVAVAGADQGRLKVIIDADPAIGEPFKDVDDGLMLLAALRSPELDVLGITTTFGKALQIVVMSPFCAAHLNTTRRGKRPRRASSSWRWLDDTPAR